MSLRPLFRSRWQMLRNSYRLSGRKQRLTWVAMAAGWAAIAFWLVWALVVEFAKTSSLPMLEHSLTAMFFYLGMLMLLSAAPLTFGAMLQSQDLSWLLASPTPPGSVVLLKMLDGVLGSARVFLPFCIPAYVASALLLGYSPIGWAWALGLWLGYCLVVAVLVELLLVIAVQMLPITRIPSAIFGLNLLVSAMLTVYLARDPQGLSGGIPLLRMPVPNLYLSQWCAEAFSAWIQRDYLTVAVDTAIVYALLALIVTATTLFGRRLYSDVRYIEGATDAPKLARRRHISTDRKPSVANGIARKDLACYLRDPQILSQALAPLLIALLPFVFAVRFSGYSELIQFVCVSTLAVTLYVQSSVLSLSAVGLEGRTYWLIRTSPVTPIAFLVAKWWFCLRCVMATATFLLVLMWLTLRLPHELATTMWAIALGVSMTLCGLGVGLSALFPRFVYDNPAQRISVWALLWGFALYISYITVSGTVVFLAYMTLSRMDNPSNFWVWASADSVLLLISLVFGLVPLVLGARRLASYEWEH